ncbi:hypothetical protein PILCRDRAFT_817872 [Piloderma croceum F 1598]|uniref:Uncharacterized protein n=1 Tax=Piloderma croceum (strain F 1598) TaxID=765440 RepID=A0A0C3FZ52_PILCF|nr:hypothetical protein PILCRDRAFT_817872 [Piloderma croceum F 1598]
MRKDRGKIFQTALNPSDGVQVCGDHGAITFMAGGVYQLNFQLCLQWLPFWALDGYYRVFKRPHKNVSSFQCLSQHSQDSGFLVRFSTIT